MKDELLAHINEEIDRLLLRKSKLFESMKSSGVLPQSDMSKHNLLSTTPDMRTEERSMKVRLDAEKGIVLASALRQGNST